jgi:soluble lytic murein transglycosylase-like protein
MARVIPSMHEFRGAPIPGLRAGATQGVRRVLPFVQQLERLQAELRTNAGGAAQAATKGAQPGGRAPTRIVQPPFVAPPRVQRTPPPRPGGKPASAGRTRYRPTTSPEKRALASQIHVASKQAGVDPNVAVAIARAESSLNPRAVSPDGISVGAFQVTWDTKAEMRRKFAAGAVDRPSGTDDVAMGVAYLRYLHDLFGRQASLGRGRTIVPIANQQERQRFVAAAYNAGEGAVARAQGRVAASGRNPTDFENIRPYLPSITQAYVDRVGRFTGQERSQSTAQS